MDDPKAFRKLYPKVDLFKLAGFFDKTFPCLVPGLPKPDRFNASALVKKLRSMGASPQVYGI